ncbi:MAG: hypothetical protein E7190_01130 [Erysipelotrichaceae bacterium]|nr:hypothetical protein [Erysipelotrichaceae bacterium]
MMNRFYQRIISELRMTIRPVFGVADRNGEIVACSDESQIGKTISGFRMEQDLFVQNGITFRTLPASSANRYAVFVYSTESSAAEQASLIASFLKIMMKEDESAETQTELLRKVLYGLIPEGVLYEKLKGININDMVGHYVAVVHALSGYQPRFFHFCDTFLISHDRDFIFLDDERNVILIREDNREDPERLFAQQLKQLESEYGISASAGISTVSTNLLDLPELYREADLAMKAACACDPAKAVMVSGHLGYAGVIGRMLQEECREYLEETDLDLIVNDEEMLFTIRKFLENDLNISETAKKLYINRNTLIYRLNKIQKDTGLDLRKFDDAMTFRTALMVRNHQKSGR